MKMKIEHFNFIKSEIQKVLVKHNSNGELVAAYSKGEFARSEKCKCYQTRFNFDLFFAAGLNKFASDELYSYLNDNHIATALNKICPKLELAQ